MLLRVAFATVAGFFAAGTLAGPVAAGSGVAKDVQIGSATLSLPTPEGYCELVEQQPSDARVLKVIGDLAAGAQNDLLIVAADCGQLDTWRAGKLLSLDDYVQYQTPTPARNSIFPRAESIKEFCATTRAQGETKISGVAPDINARLEAAVKGAKFNETSFLGVLAEDADACYFGLLLRIRTETGAEKTQVTVSATTFVRGKIVFYNLYTAYHDAGSVAAALARHRPNVAALLAANEE
jgi:hypothetical protein